MTNEEITRLTHEITEALKPYIDTQIALKVSEAVFEIRNDIRNSVSGYLHDIIRESVASSIYVRVEVLKK